MTAGDVLARAAAAGDTAKLTALLGRGADVSAQNSEGKNALSLAASNGHTASVALLLDRGADVAATDNEGWTALKRNCCRLRCCGPRTMMHIASLRWTAHASVLGINVNPVHA